MPTLLEFIKTSMIRPGVPITNYGLFRSAISCFCIELAPITRAAYKFVYLLSLENYS